MMLPQDKVTNVYMVAYRCVLLSQDSSEDETSFERWFDEHGDYGYAFLQTVKPLEEFSPDEFEEALFSLGELDKVPKGILFVPLFIQSLKYVPPTDDETNITKIPLSILGGKKK